MHLDVLHKLMDWWICTWCTRSRTTSRRTCFLRWSHSDESL